MKKCKVLVSVLMAVALLAVMAVTSFAASGSADGVYPQTAINDGVLWKFVSTGTYWNIINVETGEYLAKDGNLSISATAADEWDYHGTTLERKTNTGGTVHIGTANRYSLGDATDTYLYKKTIEGNTIKYVKVDAPEDGEVYLIVGTKDGGYHAITNYHNDKAGTSDCRVLSLEVTIDGDYARSFGATADETIAVDETEAPIDETEAPVDETEAPVDETKAPVDETEAPVDETEAPVDETEAPVDETEAPVDETEAPVATDAPVTAAPTTTPDTTTATQTSDIALVSGLGVLALSAAAIVCLGKKRG